MTRLGWWSVATIMVLALVAPAGASSAHSAHSAHSARERAAAPAVPATWVKSWSRKATANAAVGRRVSITATVLSPRGRAARARVSYRWYVGGRLTTSRGRVFTVPTSACGLPVQVRATVARSGYRSRSIVRGFGTVASGSQLDRWRCRIVTDTNGVRAAHGRRPLRMMPALNAVAQDWTQQMVDARVLAHNPSYWKQYPPGWSAAAENVAMGHLPATVVRGWMGSTGHRANILGPSNNIGVGVVRDGNGSFWFTQNFATY